MTEPEGDRDAVLIGWLRGDDYEAALAFRRRDAGQDGRPPAPTSLADRRGRRAPSAPDREA